MGFTAPWDLSSMAGASAFYFEALAIAGAEKGLNSPSPN